MIAYIRGVLAEKEPTRVVIEAAGVGYALTIPLSTTDDFQILGIHQLDQVLHDDVHAILVEVAMVAEAEEVELEALALHHQRARNVVDNDVSKVRLTRFGAQRSKLRAIQRYQIVVLRMLVLEGFQHLRGIVVTVLGILITQ